MCVLDSGCRVLLYLVRAHDGYRHLWWATELAVITQLAGNERPPRNDAMHDAQKRTSDSS